MAIVAGARATGTLGLKFFRERAAQPPPDPLIGLILSAQVDEQTRRAMVLALSAERDAWRRRIVQAEEEAGARGFADGQAAERRRADRAWAAQPRLTVAVVPSHAELEHARHCREHFGDKRPGDFPGRAR